MRRINPEDVLQPATFLWQEETNCLRVVQPGTGRDILLNGLAAEIWYLVYDRKPAGQIADELKRPWEEVSAMLEQFYQLQLVQKAAGLLPFEDTSTEALKGVNP